MNNLYQLSLSEMEELLGSCRKVDVRHALQYGIDEQGEPMARFVADEPGSDS